MNQWDALVDLLETGALGGRAHVAVTEFRRLIEDLRAKVGALPLHTLFEEVLQRTGYQAMLDEDRDPSAETRKENLQELINAAGEAHERGEGLAEFLDHAALVADADQVDEKAQVSLLTAHNAKGLEFPSVFLAGMEEGLFPHSRSIDRPNMLEEERRLCYVGMTRAEQRLYMSWARSRRRWGGGPAEPSLPSRFLRELPPELCDLQGLPLLSQEEERQVEYPDEVDLYAERDYVRQTAQFRRPSPAATYNSEESITGFFGNRGTKAPSGSPSRSYSAPPPKAAPPARVQSAKVASAPPVRRQKEGATVEHPKYGRGTILRKEGDGDDAKLTVLFPGHGLKKLVAKYAQLKHDA
jgi:DNA helicase-2/ATP-dependent DNA helicase PcrA